MSSSEISSLSSAPSTDDDRPPNSIRGGNLDHYFKQAANAEIQASPPPKKQRPASPPHEYVLADNEDIAFIVMFRSRFSDAFPKSLPHYGPQDIERGVVDTLPGEHVERLLCALLGLVLNRKKDVERGHYQRALDEAVLTHTSQWPPSWNHKNPLHGGVNFLNMSPAARLTLLKTLIIWSLGSSEAIQAVIKQQYKQQRVDDDLNQPLSVQPWGRDGDRRRYWLIEGQDDTHFRLYRESNPALKHNTWRSVAGTIDELKVVAGRLSEDGTQASRRLRDRITVAIPRFEASEEKRKRRDYRNSRKAQFTRPEPGFSLYEGRTRGNRIRYTFSDEEEGGSDEPSSRRSNRQSGFSTPAEASGPTFTASGRQVRSRHGGPYGESTLSGQREDGQNPTVSGQESTNGADTQLEDPGRTRRSVMRGVSSSKPPVRDHIEGYNALDEMEDESDASSSGAEWDGGDDEEVDEKVAEEEESDVEMSEDVSADDDETGNMAQQSLVVSLRYQKKRDPTRETKFEDPGDSIRLNGVGHSVIPSGDNGVLSKKSSGPSPENLTNGHMPRPIPTVTTPAPATLQ